MDSLMFFLEMYKRASFFRIIRNAYRSGQSQNIGLLAYSVVTLVVLALLSFSKRDAYIFLGLLMIAIWGVWLGKAIKNAYRHYEIDNADRLRFYSKERQYLRYLIFRDEIIDDVRSHGVSIEDALLHLTADLETESTDVLGTSLFVTIIIAFISSLIGSLSGKWDTPYLALALFVSVSALLLKVAVIGSMRSRKTKLLELKRYLLWLQQEGALTLRSRGTRLGEAFLGE